MGAIRRILSELKATGLSHVASRRVDVRLSRPTCSITFDDVPRSAFRNGVPILRAHEVPATFYVAAGLSAKEDFLTPDEVRALVADGFDVGCHTYSHYSLYRGTADGLVADAARNREAFVAELGIPMPRDFSYPFGEVSVNAKRGLGGDYVTLRSVYPGLNGPGTDLLLLRANPIFSASLQWDRIRRLLDGVRRESAWIIFYTHGVTDQPDPWSCTPRELMMLIDKCQTSGIRLRSIGEVGHELLPPGP